MRGREGRVGERVEQERIELGWVNIVESHDLVGKLMIARSRARDGEEKATVVLIAIVNDDEYHDEALTAAPLRSQRVEYVPFRPRSLPIPLMMPPRPSGTVKPSRF